VTATHDRPMDRHTADRVAALLVGVVLIVGAALTWDAYRTQQSLSGMESMMGTAMPGVHGTDPVVVVAATVGVAAVVGGGYLLLRPDLPTGTDAPARPRPAVLDVLPADERRVLEPVIESPGITQLALRDRADFSKAKISQTVASLEERACSTGSARAAPTGSTQARTSPRSEAVSPRGGLGRGRRGWPSPL